MIELKIYDIGTLHKEDWNVYINTVKAFSYQEGAIKFEANGRQRTTLTLSWETVEQADNLVQNYLDGLEAQYKKKKKAYHILEKKVVEISGHEAGFVHSTLHSNPKLYLGKSSETIQLHIFQMVHFCTHSKRILLKTFTCTQEYWAENETELTQMLYSTHCHSEVDGL